MKETRLPSIKNVELDIKAQLLQTGFSLYKNGTIRVEYDSEKDTIYGKFDFTYRTKIYTLSIVLRRYEFYEYVSLKGSKATDDPIFEYRYGSEIFSPSEYFSANKSFLRVAKARIDRTYPTSQERLYKAIFGEEKEESQIVRLKKENEEQRKAIQKLVKENNDLTLKLDKICEIVCVKKEKGNE